MCLLEVRRARTIQDQLLRLELVVLSGLLQQNFLEFLFIQFARVFADLDEHLDRGADLGLLDDLTITLKPNVFHQKANETIFDSLILDHVVLKLTVLHVLNKRQVKLWHIILVHVEKDVSNHHDAFFDLLPHAIELSEELLIVGETNVLCNRLQQLNCCLFDTFVEHLAMLVEHKVVCRAVQFLVTQRARLLVVDLVDGILDSFPMLLGLGPLHIGITHLIAINQELIRWEV